MISPMEAKLPPEQAGYRYALKIEPLHLRY
jgi:hypothetical protein